MKKIIWILIAISMLLLSCDDRKIRISVTIGDNTQINFTLSANSPPTGSAILEQDQLFARFQLSANDNVFIDALDFRLFGTTNALNVMYDSNAVVTIFHQGNLIGSGNFSPQGDVLHVQLFSPLYLNSAKDIDVYVDTKAYSGTWNLGDELGVSIEQTIWFSSNDPSLTSSVVMLDSNRFTY